MARAMVTQWGMSEKLGPIRYGEHEEMMFLDRSISEHRNYSDKVAQEIDEEVKRLVDEAHKRCRELLMENWDAMKRVAERLLEVETHQRTGIRGAHARRDPRRQHRSHVEPGECCQPLQARPVRCAATTSAPTAVSISAVACHSPSDAGR